MDWRKKEVNRSINQIDQTFSKSQSFEKVVARQVLLYLRAGGGFARVDEIETMRYYRRIVSNEKVEKTYVFRTFELSTQSHSYFVSVREESHSEYARPEILGVARIF